jgi:hypothetical protein
MRRDAKLRGSVLACARFVLARRKKTPECAVPPTLSTRSSTLGVAYSTIDTVEMDCLGRNQPGLQSNDFAVPADQSMSNSICTKGTDAGRLANDATDADNVIRVIRCLFHGRALAQKSGFLSLPVSPGGYTKLLSILHIGSSLGRFMADKLR